MKVVLFKANVTKMKSKFGHSVLWWWSLFIRQLTKPRDLVLFCFVIRRRRTKHGNGTKKQISDLSRNLMVRLLREANINFVTGQSDEHKFWCLGRTTFWKSLILHLHYIVVKIRIEIDWSNLSKSLGHENFVLKNDMKYLSKRNENLMQ